MRLRAFAKVLPVLLLLAGLGPRGAAAAPLDDALSYQKKAESSLEHGRYAEAEAFEHRAIAALDRRFGTGNFLSSTAQTRLAAIYSAERRFGEAEKLLKRVLDSMSAADPLRAQLDPHSAARANAAHNLAQLYVGQARFREAEPLFQQAIEIFQAAHETDREASTENELANLYLQQGRYAAAERLCQHALTIQTSKHDSATFARTLNALGTVYLEDGRYERAEPLFKQALELFEQTGSAESATVLGNMAVLYTKEGRAAEAEKLLKRALTTGGRSDTDTARDVTNLAYSYFELGRPAEAERLARRGLALFEASLGPDHPDVATAMHNLAGMYAGQGRYPEAERLEKRALAIREKAIGPDHPAVAISLNSLGATYNDERRYGEAEPLLKRAIAIGEKDFGQDHEIIATPLRNLATLYMAEHRYAGADPLFQRVLAMRERIFGPDHPSVARSLIELADAEMAEGFSGSARASCLRAVQILEHWLADAEAARSGAAISERQSYRDHFLLAVSILSRAAPPPGDDARAGIPEDAFRAAQLARSSAASVSLTAMAARFAAGSDALAAVVREREDLARQQRQLDADLVREFSRAPAERDPQAAAWLIARSAQLRQSSDALDARIAQDFPRYAELSNPAPLTVSETQQLLAPDEAMLVYTVADDATYLWTLRRDRTSATEIAIGASGLANEVHLLRQRLDPQQNPERRPFDVERSYALYRKIVAPAAPLLEGASHVIVVPDGALESLPFQVLVTAAAKPIENPADYRKVAWFARAHAVTMLPAVASLRALRRFAKPTTAPRPFIGVGDPLLGSPPQCHQAVTLASVFRGADGDLDAVRQLCSLPETSEELQALARAEGAGAAELYLGKQATEAAIDALPLASYRVVAFATHALVAGDIKGLAEPALVLTPPAAQTAKDDGLLTASEVTQLKLDADLVILSACNTAAGETPGAEGLSGLAKAFFYAGARSLLVSHWPVLSDAAEELTVHSLGVLRRNPGLGRAEALRRAEMDLLDNGDAAESHPMAWAPFSLIGEGADKP